MQTESFHTFQLALGKSLRSHRKAAGLSQEKAAFALGMDRVSIGYIEQGVRAPKLSTLYGLSRLYGVRLPELFAFDGQESAAELAGEAAGE